MSEEKVKTKMEKSDYWGMYAFECVCGARMATNGQRLHQDIAGAKFYKCPNHLYGTCNRSYSAEHFKRVANFIPAIIPVSL